MNADTAIDKDNLKRQYQKVGFSPAVIDGLVKAHECVFQKGTSTGWEWVVSVNCSTGEFMGEPHTNKKPGTVTWRHEGNIAGVHNHPENTPPSDIDIFSFSLNKEARALSVQGHNGCFYVLTRNKKDSTTLTLSNIQDKIDTTVLKDCFKALSCPQKFEIAVKSIASDMNWGFLKGGGRNEKK